ncbi:hypothetical protein JW998_12795, partial [candidate division KSB1 bacterium]|nr:hypothetical protein [candidate division KSB1 bacterium]
DARATVWRWRPAFQADFQARMDWCIKSAGQGNRPPVPLLQGDSGRDVVQMSAQPGQAIRLNAAGSWDPDNDRVNFRWFIYPEAGTVDQDIHLVSANEETLLNLPGDAAGKTIHLILQVTDNGEPPLTRYRRAIIRVGDGNR